MTISPPPKRLIYETIERLAAEQLWQLWNFLERLAGAEEEMVPLYQIHHDAIATGISDLAHQHDHYLYGQEKHND
jgi:hypothetical protein